MEDITTQGISIPTLFAHLLLVQFPNNRSDDPGIRSIALCPYKLSIVLPEDPLFVVHKVVDDLFLVRT